MSSQSRGFLNEPVWGGAPEPGSAGRFQIETNEKGHVTMVMRAPAREGDGAAGVRLLMRPDLSAQEAQSLLRVLNRSIAGVDFIGLDGED